MDHFLLHRKSAFAAVLGLALALGVPSASVAVDGGGGSGGSSRSSASAFNIAKEMQLARSKIDAGRYGSAIRVLNDVVRADRRNADAYNLLGFANRKLEKYARAGKFYKRALKISPQHLGALEYQGELFLILNQPDKAQANLALLLALCGTSCEEYLDLKGDLSAHAKRS